MGLLLGYVEDVVVKAVLEMDAIDAETKERVARAFNKLLWIQNDLFARHYVVDIDAGTRPRGMEATKVSTYPGGLGFARALALSNMSRLVVGMQGITTL